MEIMLDYGSNANIYDDDESVPLTRACQKGHLASATLIIDQENANFKAVNKAGWIMLTEVSWHGSANLFEALLDRAANKDMCNYKGQSLRTPAL